MGKGNSLTLMLFRLSKRRVHECFFAEFLLTTYWSFPVFYFLACQYTSAAISNRASSSNFAAPIFMGNWVRVPAFTAFSPLPLKFRSHGLWRGGTYKSSRVEPQLFPMYPIFPWDQKSRERGSNNSFLCRNSASPGQTQQQRFSRPT